MMRYYNLSQVKTLATYSNPLNLRPQISTLRNHPQIKSKHKRS